MGSWNYRVTVQTLPEPVTGGTVEEYAIREVYYDDDGRPTSWSVDPVRVAGESWADVANDLATMGRAIPLPVLDISEWPPVEQSPLDIDRGQWKPAPGPPKPPPPPPGRMVG